MSMIWRISVTPSPAVCRKVLQNSIASSLDEAFKRA